MRLDNVGRGEHLLKEIQQAEKTKVELGIPCPEDCQGKICEA